MDTLKNLFAKLTGKASVPAGGGSASFDVNALDALGDLTFPADKETIASTLERSGADQRLVKAVRFAEKRRYDSVSEVRRTITNAM